MLVFSNIFTYFQEPSIDKCFCIFQVLLKSYGHVYDWYIENGDYNGHDPTTDHDAEQQGESVCWDKEGNGYYTLSEGNYQPLWYCRRRGAKP